VRVLCVGNMYPPHHLGGYELVWQGAVRNLRERGHDVAVLTTDHREDGVEEPDEPGVHRELRWWWRDHAWPRHSPWARLAVERHNAAAFDRVAESFRPDAVAWWAMGGMSLSLIARAGRAGLPACGFVHDDWLVYGQKTDRWTAPFRRRPRLGAAVQRVTGIPTRFEPEVVECWWFVSDHVRRTAQDAGVALGRTGIASSGIDASFLGPAPPRTWEWRLLYVGRIDERKGTATAVRALVELPEQATLTVVGDGDAAHLRELRVLADRLGAGPRVRFEPARPRAELPAVYDAHDATVFPVTWEEPWGLVPLEAMARGRPVAATGRGGSGEYLLDGENCVLFEAGVAGSLASAIRRLAADQELRDRLREHGLATASRHTEARFNSAVEAALRELDGARPPTPRRRPDG
jgi:glycogen(starch) synthase